MCLESSHPRSRRTHFDHLVNIKGLLHTPRTKTVLLCKLINCLEHGVQSVLSLNISCKRSASFSLLVLFLVICSKTSSSFLLFYVFAGGGGRRSVRLRNFIHPSIHPYDPYMHRDLARLKNNQRRSWRKRKKTETGRKSWYAHAGSRC